MIAPFTSPYEMKKFEVLYFGKGTEIKLRVGPTHLKKKILPTYTRSL